MSIGVVHLVRRGNAPALLERFLSSYAAYGAGIEHELVLALKGYDTEGPRELLALLAHAPARCVMIPDRGYDVQSYARVARELGHDDLCFLNSHTEVLAADWLLKLHSALRQPSVGLVGATGSWQGFFRNFDGATPDLEPVRLGRPPWKAALIHRLPWLSGMQSAVLGPVLRPLFRPFPNPHVRTTGFMCARDTIARAAGARAYTKLGAYAFESGSRSLTRQVSGRGLATLLVARSGEAFPPERWFEGNTFWRGEQEGLLLADNRTRDYAEGSPEARAIYSLMAWGPHADPGTRP